MQLARAFSSLLGLAILALGLTSTGAARADEPEPLVRFDPDAVPPPSSRTSVLLIGTAMTAISYGGAVGASYIWETDSGASDLRIPVVGPWIKIGHTTLCHGAEACNDVMQVVGAVMAGIDGVAQVGGLALLVEGIFSPAGEKRLSSPSARAWQGRSNRGLFSSYFTAEVAGATFVPVPFVQSGSDVGIGLVGTF